MRTADLQGQAEGLVAESYLDGEAVVISSTDHEFPRPTRAIYIGGAGNLIVVLATGRKLTFMALPVGTVLRIAAVKVVRTSTTATLMLGLW